MSVLVRTVPAPADMGTEVVHVPAGTDVDLDLSLESVVEGVYVTGTAEADTAGECVRCLDPMRSQVTAQLQELFLYDPPQASDEDAEELPLVDGDWIDVEPLLRDAVVTALPFQPVCSPDCPGLCSRCGARLADDPDHHHEELDPRWAALGSIDLTANGTGSTGDQITTHEES